MLFLILKGFRHDVDMPVWLNVLNATEKMIHVLNERGDQGQGPDADVPQNILTLLGKCIHFFSKLTQQ